MNRTAYYLPEHLDARLEHLASESYHLFVNGRWTYSFRTPDTLLPAYREFAQMGQACTVVAAGEIAFYCVRPVKAGDWVSVGGSHIIECVKRVARNGRWADVNWRTYSKRMHMQVLTIEHTITAGQWEITDLTRRAELESRARS
jgi:hypothetical protein